jgi:hypothetical protein
MWRRWWTVLAVGLLGCTGSGATQDAAVPIDATVPDGTSSLAITPSGHDFGGFPLGCPTLVQQFTVTNPGTVATGPLMMMTAGTGASEFQIEASTTCRGTLAPLASCTIDLGFHPTGAGGKTATLEVSATPGGIVRSPLSAIGLAPAPLGVSPGALPFGMVVVGTTAATRDVTISNNCSIALPAMGVTIAGQDPADFAVMTNSCPTSIPPAATCTLTMAFTPSTVGNRSAHVTAAFGTSTVISGLFGEGVAAAQ